MNKILIKILLCFALLQLDACTTDEKQPAQPIKIHRLDLAMKNYVTMSPSERLALADSLVNGLNAVMAIHGIAEITDSVLMDYSQSPAVRIFTPDVETCMPDLSSIEQTLGEVERSAKELLPSIGRARYYAIVSPYNQSIYIADDVVLIALNHYLGEDYPGYSGFEKYQCAIKTQAHLPYDVVEATICTEFPYQPSSDALVLNRLLYEGAIVESMMQLLPDADLAEIMGCDAQGMKWLQENEAQAWNALISRKLLYSSSIADADKLVNPSPSTTILHPDSPGRVGRFIGYKIVKAYLKNNPNVSLEDILSPEFYNSRQSLIASQYAGK